MTVQPSREYVRGIVTHLHDRRMTDGNIVICIAIEGDSGTGSIPVTYPTSGSLEQGDLLDVASSVKVGDEVATWYVEHSADAPNRATGHTLRILGSTPSS